MIKEKRKIVACSIVIFLAIIFNSFCIPKTKSVDPFFTLVAVGSTPAHMDYLNLIKQQLIRIGVNIDIRLQDFSWTPPELPAFRDFDMQILEIKNESYIDPFFSDFYRENGSYNLSGYHTSMDWDDELNSGRNEWFIKSGLQMILNNSQEQKEFCWEWQNYLLDDILPCLPLFTKVDDNSTFQLLVFNMREVRPIIGSRSPAPSYPYKSIGLAVRKAITYAIDREEIKNIVLGEDYEIIHHPISPIMSSWLNPNVVRYCHDLTAARDFMTTIMYSIWPPTKYTYTGYGPWPNWEDVCSKNMITYKYPGFDIFCTIIILVILSQIFLINRLKTLKKKKKNLIPHF